jgi:hypothetical protein
MSTATGDPAGTPKKGGNKLLWGCLILVLLFFVSICCLVSLAFLSISRGIDPLGIDLQNRIEQYIPLEEFLDDPSVVPGLPEILDESFPEEGFAPGPVTGADAIVLSTYIPDDFQAVFDYPAGWEIEVEDFGVTFYDTQSYTYLYVGEDLVEPGVTAREVSRDVMNSLREEAQDDTFKVFESAPFSVATGDDAYLAAFEFVDIDGYYQWALDLETVSGESNVFFYLSGEDPEDYELYRELIEIIAASFSR